MNAELRRSQEFAKPIAIGSDVWVGGGAIIAFEPLPRLVGLRKGLNLKAVQGGEQVDLS